MNKFVHGKWNRTMKTLINSEAVSDASTNNQSITKLPESIGFCRHRFRKSDFQGRRLAKNLDTCEGALLTSA